MKVLDVLEYWHRLRAKSQDDSAIDQTVPSTGLRSNALQISIMASCCSQCSYKVPFSYPEGKDLSSRNVNDSLEAS